MTKVRPIYLRLLMFAVVILGLVWVNKLRSSRAKAGSLTNTSVTMSNSRLSYRGMLDGDPGGSNLVDILVDTAITDYVPAYEGTVPDEYTDGLVEGDTITMTGATADDRIIEEILDANTIRLDDTLTNSGEIFYSDQTTDLTVQFTTNTYVAGTSDFSGGYFEVLIPALDAANSADDVPDQDMFDFGSTTASSVSCTDGSSHTIVGTDTSSGATGFREGDRGVGGTANPLYNETNNYHSDYWHAYRCNYSGGGVDDTITMTISNLINPAPASNHDTGTADTYDIIVRHMDGDTTDANYTDDVEIDATWVKIGAIEAVQVSARVLPILTFTIEGVAGSTANVCGVTTDVTTTADSVPLGALSTGDFTDAGQLLTVTTNAVGGASVTAIANDQLGHEGGTCTGDTYNSTYNCIWDANVASMTHEDSTGTAGEEDWDASTTSPGFAFSLDPSGGVGTTNTDFSYDDPGDFMARHFADAEAPQDPQLIFDTGGPTNDDDTYVCYRAKADALTAAGFYYNYITYTATATF